MFRARWPGLLIALGLLASLSALRLHGAGIDYAVTIQPIFSGCTGCHGSGGGLSLESPGSYGNLVNRDARNDNTFRATFRVRPNDPTGSALMVIANSGGHNNATINLTQRNAISDWINQGALPDTKPPVVANVSPSTGATTGGSSVTISGTNFGGTGAFVPTVTFGGVPATNVVVTFRTPVTPGDVSTQITCTTPAHAAGSVEVVVTTTVGGASAPLNNGFTYSSSNADLSNLALSTGTLTPAFSAGTNSYAASAPNATTSVTVTPTGADANATISVNGATVASGTPSGLISLNVGTNTITTLVTAQDGTTTRTYTVTVTRAVSSNNANLSNLVLSTGALTPAFSSGTTAYTASVPNATTSMTVTPTKADPNASITVNGATVASGTPSGSINLNVGANTITTIVTAQNGTTTKAYTVTVMRAASSNANLSSLVLSAGALTPAFTPATTSYTASVPNATASMTVTPTKTDANATITVNGVTVVSGTASGAISLNVGANTITTVVTVQNGSATRTYTLTVMRAPPSSGNADLSNLVLNAGTLTPAFAPGTTSYAVGVPNATSSITVTPGKADLNASITVNGVTVASGTASGLINLNLGANTITTVVTAQNGTTTKAYTVTVTRAVSSNNADLANVVLSAGTLTPSFSAGTTSYTSSVPNATAAMAVTPTKADANASITVNGAPVASGTTSGLISLNTGANTITTVVTAEDGTTTKAYTVTVTRAASSSNADLSNLVLSAGALTPAFSSGTTSYTSSVPNATISITVTPTKAEPNASIAVSGVTVASGTASGLINLNVGDNTITTVVTAQNGTTTKAYTVTVARAQPSSSDANLSNLVLSTGALTPAFSSGTTSYTSSVPNATISITVTPTKAEPNASITLNGVTVASGAASGSINLNVGANAITTIVTAQDGTTTKSYTVAVTRLGLPSGVPVNDDFANAQILPGDAGKIVGTNVGATRETGEPEHAAGPGGHSVWYRWTAPSTGAVTFDTFESDFDTVLAAYTGTPVNALTQTARNDDDKASGSNLSRLSFDAIAGNLYYIAVDGFSGATGNIVLNYYRGRVPVAGTYFGLIETDPNLKVTPGYRHAIAGFIKITVTPAGNFTSTVTYAGQTAHLRGSFGDKVSISGERKIPRHGIIDITISGETDRIIGTIQDGDATAIITAHLNVFDRRLNPAPQAGRYTLLAQPAASLPGQEEIPRGFGHGSIIIKTGGSFRMVGRLGDGTKFGASSGLSQSGEMPLYAVLYRKLGSVQGMVVLEDIENQSDGSGVLNWFKPSRQSDRFYPAGFTTQLDFLASRFLAPGRGQTILELPDSTDNLHVVLSDGSNGAIPPFDVTLNPHNRVTSDGGVGFKIRIKSKTGVFKGSFRDPSTFKRRKFSGAIFQKQQIGAGLFKGDGETGALLLESNSKSIPPLTPASP